MTLINICLDKDKDKDRSTSCLHDHGQVDVYLRVLQHF